MVCNAIDVILAAVFTFAQVFGLIMKRNQTGYSKQETTRTLSKFHQQVVFELTNTDAK